MLALLALLTFCLWRGVGGPSEITISTRDGKGATAYGVSSRDQRDKNFAAGEFIVLAERPGRSTRSVIRFDLSALTGRRKIAQASLVLTMVEPRDIAKTINVFGVKDRHEWERFDENTLNWWGPAEHAGNKDHMELLGTIQIGRQIKQSGNTLTLTSPELAEFLRKDTNDLAVFVLTAGEVDTDEIHLASKKSARLAPPLLKIKLAE